MLFSTQRIHLATEYTPTECMHRLEPVIDEGWLSSKEVLGRVTPSTIYLHKRLFYRNSFKNYLMATMRRERNQTIIEGDVGLHPLIKVFMVCWFGGVVFIGGSILIATVASFFVPG